MRSILTSVFILISTLVYAGTWSSGGGDPKIVEAIDYPDMGKVKAAVRLLQENVQKTHFNANFKVAFSEDLDKMLKMGRFYYVPDLFAVGFNRFPGDYNKLYSNGAMTEFKPAAAIWFSKQSIDYDVRTLARVIAQEVPHHIFSGRFQQDEEFANNLGTYLVTLENIPTQPYNAAQIIYEEFDHKLRDQNSTRIIQKAKDDFKQGIDVLRILYQASHNLYKNRGSFNDYHVEFAFVNQDNIKTRYPKTTDISALPKLQKEKISKCVFTTYEDGASGITERYQKLLTEAFMDLLKEFDEKITRLYYTEDFYLPATKVITNCGVGIEDDQGNIYLFKAVRRHEDNQCRLGQTCFPN